MNTTKSWIIGVLAVGLAAGISGCESPDRTAAGDRASWHWGVPQDEALRSQDLSDTRVGTTLHRATKLVGLPVRDLDGERLGDIYDLVLTPDLAHVSYIVVRSDNGFHAVPWSAVRTGATGRIFIEVGAQELMQAPGFIEWPAEGNPRWSTRAGAPLEQAGPAVSADRTSIQNRRFSHLEGMPLRGPEGRRIGTVRDLVVSTDTGAAPYAIVSFGGFLGLDREYAAIPRAAVDVDTQQWTARLDADRETLQAHAFSQDRFPDLSDPLYVQELSRAYGVESPDTALGYVPAEE
jgi:sporulation protein YlmC with PRC-barrel domain